MKYYVNLTFNCLQGLSFCESLGPAHGNKTNRNLHGTSKVDGMASPPTYLVFRCMSISGPNCAPCTRTIASLISLNVDGMEQTPPS